MRRLALEADSATALRAATDALILAAFDLADAGNYAAALRANAAARAANSQTERLCDAVLSRWWVRLFDRVIGRP